MTIEVKDAAAIEALWSHYEAAMNALMVSPRTGGDIALPTEVDERGQLLSFALHDPQVALVWGKELAYSQMEVWQPYIGLSHRRFVAFARALKREGQLPNLPKTPAYATQNGFKIGAFGHAAPSLKTFIYITDKDENLGFLRAFPKAVHVCGHHGDSDKHSSFSRLPSAYDFMLVADANSMNRYLRAGIQIETDRMIPIGNTVVKGAAFSEEASAFSRLLYAPTFEGYSEQANFSSMGRAFDQLSEWARSDGNEAVIRAHPGLGKRVQDFRKKVTAFPNSPEAAGLRRKHHQFNWSDYLIADISGVTSEYLFTGKPIIIPVAKTPEWLWSYTLGLNLRDYAYLWNYEELSLANFIATIRHDPLKEARLRRRDELYAGVRTFKQSSKLFEGSLSYFEHCHRWRELRHGGHPFPSSRRPLSASPRPTSSELGALVETLISGETTLRA